MSTPILSLEQMDSVCEIEQDWLFEKLLWKLNSHRHLFLIADQGWGIMEFVNELGFQLAEKNPEIHTCFMDIRPAHSSASFLELFVSVLLQKFPEETSCIEIDNSSMDALKLPELIAKRKKVNIEFEAIQEIIYCFSINYYLLSVIYLCFSIIVYTLFIFLIFIILLISV